MQGLRRHLINSAPLISYHTEPGEGREGKGGGGGDKLRPNVWTHTAVCTEQDERVRTM